MEDDKKKNTIELKPRTIKNVLNDWKDGIKEIGQVGFWPSWAYGQYIKPDNVKAQANKARLANRKFPDIKEKVVLRHGKLVRILFNRKTGGRVPTKDMSDANRAKLDASNKTIARQRQYFGEKNALHAITAMMRMPRNLRRMLCRKLKMQWETGNGYREAEAMIRER